MAKTLLLVLPALQEVLSREFRKIKYSLFPPLSLLTLAAMTPAEEYDVIVRDEHVEPVDVGENIGVDLVAMTVYIAGAERAYEIARMYRERGAKIVMGGIHPSTMPFEAARYADAVCIGPAEPVWGSILADFERGALKKFYRADGEGSAALVPVVARRELMNPKAYLVHQTIVASRGCPHSCDFCYKSAFWGKRFYEWRHIADIEREIDSLDDGFVFFLDDNFMGSRRHAREVFKILRGRRLVWQASASMDTARNVRFLDEAYEAGCRSLFVGFESISDKNMREVSKSVNCGGPYSDAVTAFHEAGMMINGSFVFGLDHDGPDVFDRTVEFAIENKIETATFHIMTPYPGTPIYEKLEAESRIIDRNWRHYDTKHAVFRPKLMTPEQLEAGKIRAYKEFYTWGSILRRSAGLGKAYKRLLYNIGWRKIDSLWKLGIALGMLPYLRPILAKTLADKPVIAESPEVEPFPVTESTPA